MHPNRRLAPPALALVLAAALAACSAPSRPAAGDAGRGGSTLTLGEAYEDETLNPLMGYGAGGASKLYEGLVAHDAQRDLQPDLALALPQPVDGGRAWTVEVREGVRFSDGTALGPEDVVATYRALLDPQAGSPVASSYSMLERVEAVGDEVRFTLSEPYAPFPHLLTLGIVPSERVVPGQPLAESSLNGEPVGTGPYVLAEWRRGERLRLEADPDHRDGAPEVEAVEVVFVPDDNARAQRMRRGDFDGAALPPALAKALDGTDGLQVVEHDSADYRTVMLPQGDPVTSDGAVARALNLAVDREGMIDGLLAGYGEPATTPIPPVLSQYALPEPAFTHDPDAARAELEAAGWVEGADGVRRKGDLEARFTLMYPATDSVRKALAGAFASDARKVGVAVDVEGLGWEAIEPRMGQDALVLGGGDPFDPDLQMYKLLHSRHAADGFNNPGSYADPRVDAALDRARATTDGAARATAYREAQRAAAQDPGFVFLTFLAHTYVLRDRGWQGYEPVVDPHVHGTLGWGPWWNLEDWTTAR